VLAQMIAQMKDRGGRIKIPGFYDDVRPLQDEERQAWATLPFNEKKYRKDFGIPKLFGETGYTTLERTWARPTLEVNGLLSGSPAKARRPCCRRSRWPRSACASCRTRIRTRSRICSSATCGRSPRRPSS
jgi:hypothetical protein